MRARARDLLPALLLAAATLALFAPVAREPFLDSDERLYVAENPGVRGGLSPAAVRWAFTAFHAANWHPLTWLSHQLDVSLFGLAPGPHHLVNALLHAAGAALLFLALLRLTGAPWRSLLVAALFAVHPLHVESVAWLAERKDVLSGVLWMLTLLAYARYAARPSPGRSAAVAGALAFGLMAKPMLVTLPFVLLLLDVWPLRRTAVLTAGELLREKAPLLALSAGALALTVLAQRKWGMINPLEVLPLGARVANAALGYAAYLGAAAWPGALAVHYPHPGAGLGLAQALPALLLLGLVSAAAAVLRRRRPALLVGWLWYLGTLVPVIGLVQLADQARADRYTYLPLVGVFVAVAWVLPGRGRPARTAGIIAAVAVAALAAAAHRQLGHWQSTEALFERAVAVSPGDVRALVNLGAELVRQGRLDEAVGRFHDAIRAAPGYDNAWFNLGVALAQKGDLEAAVGAYRRALALAPGHWPCHTSLGIALAELGRDDEARAHLEEAVRLQPDYAQGWFNLGVFQARRGERRAAAASFVEALRFAPEDERAREYLAMLERLEPAAAQGLD